MRRVFFIAGCLFACPQAFASLLEACLYYFEEAGVDSPYAHYYGVFPRLHGDLPLAPFPRRVVTSHPDGTSPYRFRYGDLFFRPGITFDALIKEFPPAPGSVTKGSPATAQYGGVKLTFYLNEHGEITVVRLPGPGSTEKDAANREKFVRALEEEGLAQACLEPNPYYKAEKRWLAQFKDPKTNTVTAIPKANRTKPFDLADEGIWFYGDYHYNAARLDEVLARMADPKLDWVATEFIPKTMQKDVDTYVRAREGSKEFEAARKALMEYFDRSEYNDPWNSKRSWRELLYAAKKHKMRLIALDYTKEGEFPSTLPHAAMAVRNADWAEQIPTTGRGLIYAGSAHFERPPAEDNNHPDYRYRHHDAANLANFLPQATARRPIFYINPGE